VTEHTIRLEDQLADRDGWNARRCSIGRALDVVGTRSAMLIMREAFYGARRFDEFTRRVGISDAVAASRLAELVESGLLAKTPYREPGQRTRTEYVLTDMGRDLLPVAVAFMTWGDTYLQGEAGPRGVLRHDLEEGCGEPVHVEIRCEAGHELSLEDLSIGVRPRGERSSTQVR
jgi:DNA-binding HxlR family transcriptional regulator